MEKNKSLFKNIYKTYKSYYKQDKASVIINFFSILFEGVFPLIMVLLPKFLLEELTAEVVNVNKIIFIIAFTALLTFTVNTLSTVLGVSFDMRVERFISKIRIKAGEKIVSLDQQDLETPEVLDLNAKAQNGLNWMGAVIYNSKYLFVTLITLLGCLSIIVTLNWLVIFALLIPVILSILNGLLWDKYAKIERDKLQPIWRKLLYVTDIMINFQFGKDVRMFNMEDWLIEKYNYQTIHEYKSLKKFWRNNLREAIGGSIASLITTSIVYFYLTYSVINKGISIGDFLMYSSAIFTFVGNSSSFLDCLTYSIKANRNVTDYYKFMDYQRSNQEVSNDVKDIKKFNIEFKNVSFKYPNQQEYALKNINFKINDKEKLAIIGFNGAGKSTFIKLLTRLYEPSEGEILINGNNINTYNKEDYYDLFSVVFQEINIFAFTIKENVAMTYKDQIDDKKVYDCLIKAGLKEKVDSLEKGIDTPLLKNLDENGINLSGGEAQKLVFSRAIYKDAPFSILDEPTSALDALAEYNLYYQFNNILKDKTAIFISHRLSSTRFCDRIAMFKDGEIIEIGTHDELIALKKEYYNMFVLQANYYMDGKED